jgi:hypothetical protein
MGRPCFTFYLRPQIIQFVVTAGGMTLLAHVGETGSYVRDVLPGMLVAGLGLGVAVVSVSIAILTAAFSTSRRPSFVALACGAAV